MLLRKSYKIHALVDFTGNKIINGRNSSVNKWAILEKAKETKGTRMNNKRGDRKAKLHSHLPEAPETNYYFDRPNLHQAIRTKTRREREREKRIIWYALLWNVGINLIEISYFIKKETIRIVSSSMMLMSLRRNSRESNIYEFVVYEKPSSII